MKVKNLKPIKSYSTTYKWKKLDISENEREKIHAKFRKIFNKIINENKIYNYFEKIALEFGKDQLKN